MSEYNLSTEAISIITRALSGAALRLYLIALKNADEHQEVSLPSTIGIVEGLGMSNTSLAKARQELIDRGFLAPCEGAHRYVFIPMGGGDVLGQAAAARAKKAASLVKKGAPAEVKKPPATEKNPPEREAWERDFWCAERKKIGSDYLVEHGRLAADQKEDFAKLCRALGTEQGWTNKDFYFFFKLLGCGALGVTPVDLRFHKLLSPDVQPTVFARSRATELPAEEAAAMEAAWAKTQGAVAQ